MKRLLIAAVVLAGLGGAIWWSEKQEAAKKDQPDPNAAPKILSLKEEDVKQIELQRAGEPATVLVRADDGKWSMTAPVALPVDLQPVGNLASTVTNLSSDRVIDEDLGDLTAYGLEPPVISVKLTMKDGKTTHLRIGSETPDRSSIYAAVDGDKRLFAIASFTKDTFDKSPRQLREKHLLSFDMEKLSRVDLNVTGKPPIEFGKSADGWQILKPKPLRADKLEVDELVRQLKEAEMDVAAAEDEAAKAFASGKPYSMARVTGPEGVQTLEVRKAADEYYAKSSVVAGAFKVTPALGTAVGRTLDDFQNKKLFDFGFDDPNKVQFKSKEIDKTFEKNGADWLGNGRTMDSVSVQSLIDKLRELSASKVDEAAMGKPETEVTVVSKEGARTETIQMSPSGADYLARRANEPAVYRIDGFVITGLQQAVTDVQEAAPPAKDDKNNKKK